MRFLDTNQVGFDPHALGFPSVQSCQAIVYQTDIGLFGFHASSSNLLSHTKKAEAFAQYVQNRSMTHAPPHGATHGVCVIGVITRFERFGDKQGTTAHWGDELDAIATQLAFTGPVYGAQVMSHVGQNESIYVRFDWHANARCTVRFKRWSKMEYYQAGVDVNDPERRNLAIDPLSVVTPVNPTPNYVNVQPGTQEQNVHRQGRTNEGSLNKITSFKRFN
jgi:hypothetical protein